MKPRYSVIIATKNNELTIKYVLKSTLILTKRYDVELIIVEGNSIDNTYSIVKRFTEENRSYYTSLKTLKDPGTSSSFARHLGSKNSEGEVLIFLDGDTPLTNSFKYYLESELENSDLISPLTEVIALDKATKAFNELGRLWMLLTKSTRINDPSILIPARIFKRKVLERIKGYPVSSRYFGEDRILTALAVRLGFRYKFSTHLKLLKIDEPTYTAYWKKHLRYGLGMNKDVSLIGKRILRGYILARRISHVNVILPLLTIMCAGKAYLHTKSFRKSLQVVLMKHLIDFSMFLGDLKGLLFSTAD